MIDFKAIETFMTVAKLASFTKAADQLHTTQPAISKRVWLLEEDIGARLLERGKRTVRPTPEGRSLLEYGEKLVRLRAEMLSAVGGSAAVSGLIRIGSSETIVHTWLPQLVRRASEQFPRLSLEIEVDISPRLQERLMVGALDLAFMVGPVNLPNVRSVEIAKYPMAFVASPDIKLPRKTVELNELTKWPIATFSRGSKPFEAVRDLFLSTGTLSPRIHACASLAPVVKMALEGICVAAIPPTIVEDHLRNGSLRNLNCVGQLPQLQFDAAWRSDSTDNAILGLVNFARELGEPRNKSKPKTGRKSSRHLLEGRTAS